MTLRTPSCSWFRDSATGGVRTAYIVAGKDATMRHLCAAGSAAVLAVRQLQQRAVPGARCGQRRWNWMQMR